MDKATASLVQDILGMSPENMAYIRDRLETMGLEDREIMESCIQDHPGLTPEKYMEEVVADGF